MLTWIERKDQVPGEDFSILENGLEVLDSSCGKMLTHDRETCGVLEVDDRGIGWHWILFFFKEG